MPGQVAVVRWMTATRRAPYDSLFIRLRSNWRTNQSHCGSSIGIIAPAQSGMAATRPTTQHDRPNIKDPSLRHPNVLRAVALARLDRPLHVRASLLLPQSVARRRR